jgi:hypothetical protein
MTPSEDNLSRRERKKLCTLKDIGKKYISEALKNNSKLICPAQKSGRSKRVG